MTDPDPTDADRHPTLSEAGQRMLDYLAQHRHAPVFRNKSGSRLTAHDLARLRVFEAGVAEAGCVGQRGGEPPWLADFVARCYADVPHYRARGVAPSGFEAIPTTRRADLAHDITAFVPDSVALDRLINFRTSGVTGHPLLIPSHPLVAASYLAFHRLALRRYGIELTAGRNDVGVVLLGYQRQCFTYVSVIPAMDEAGYVKLNLHPDDWRSPEDRAQYLDALRPEILSGDPISFSALLALSMTWKPRALVSTSMTLLPALRNELETRFSCPVLDVYSMTEAGPIGVYDACAGGHVLLQQQLLVEILDPAGKRVRLGERGEITLTGGFNFCLPLLRYRTGDYASLQTRSNETVLCGLSGRAPVRFRTTDGAWINNNDVTHALRALPLWQYRLHQHADGQLQFEYAVDRNMDIEVTRILHGIFGADRMLDVRQTNFGNIKVVPYTSDAVSNNGI
jgi:phenylacetate-CoA ligase